MRMRVGEAGHDDLAAAIDAERVGEPVEDLAGRADPGDPAVSDRDGRRVTDAASTVDGDEGRVSDDVGHVAPVVSENSAHARAAR